MRDPREFSTMQLRQAVDNPAYSSAFRRHGGFRSVRRWEAGDRFEVKLEEGEQLGQWTPITPMLVDHANPDEGFLPLILADMLFRHLDPVNEEPNLAAIRARSGLNDSLLLEMLAGNDPWLHERLYEIITSTFDRIHKTQKGGTDEERPV